MPAALTTPVFRKWITRDHETAAQVADRLAAAAHAEIREMCRGIRLELGIINPAAVNRIRKLHEIVSGRFYRLPHPLFKCPECGEQLAFEVDALDPWFGMIIGTGLRVMCCEEDEEWMRAFDADEYPKWEHRWWQSDWQPVQDRIERYVVRRCRVVERTR